MPGPEVAVDECLRWASLYLFVLEDAILGFELAELLLQLQVFLLVTLEIVKVALELLNDDFFLVGFDPQRRVELG